MSVTRVIFIASTIVFGLVLMGLMALYYRYTAAFYPTLLPTGKLVLPGWSLAIAFGLGITLMGAITIRR